MCPCGRVILLHSDEKINSRPLRCLPNKMKSYPKPKPPSSQLILAPSWLSDIRARTEYIRIVKELGGNLKQVDISLIADYAKSFARIFVLEEKVLEHGATSVSSKGAEYVGPWMTMLMAERTHLATLRRDLFFTPKSRGTGSQPTGKAKGILDRLRAQEEEPET